MAVVVESKIRALNLQELPQKKIVKQWASKVLEFSSQYGTPDWGAACVCGGPRVFPKYGDNSMAWAPASYNGREFLVIEFATPVVPESFNIYETLGCGGLEEIQAQTADGWQTIWKGTPSMLNDAKARIFTVKPSFAIPAPVKVFRFNMNLVSFSTWYEIDAIELVGDSEAPPEKDIQDPRGTLAGDLASLLFDVSGDVDFVTPDGVVLHAHSAILRCRSEAFSTLKSPPFSPIMVQETPAVFKLLLRYVYCGHVLVPADSCIQLYLAAERFCLRPLADQCVAVLRRAMNRDNVQKILEVVAKVPELRLACLSFIATNVVLFDNPFSIASLSKEDMQDVLVLIAKQKAQEPKN